MRGLPEPSVHSSVHSGPPGLELAPYHVVHPVQDAPVQDAPVQDEWGSLPLLNTGVRRHFRSDAPLEQHLLT